MGYTMFGSAVFYEEHAHADADYALDPIHRYRCRRGLWTCRRIYGGQGRSKAWGEIARATDYRLRAALSFEPQLKEPKCPKYLAKIIDREIATWLDWKRAHAPRVIDIDLSKLSGIPQRGGRDAGGPAHRRGSGTRGRSSPPRPPGARQKGREPRYPLRTAPPRGRRSRRPPFVQGSRTERRQPVPQRPLRRRRGKRRRAARSRLRRPLILPPFSRGSRKRRLRAHPRT